MGVGVEIFTILKSRESESNGNTARESESNWENGWESESESNWFCFDSATLITINFFSIFWI